MAGFKDKLTEALNKMYDDLIFTNEELNKIKILGKAVAFTSIIR